MKRWNKILIDRSDKITKINKAKSFKDYAEELGGYNSNQYYKNKNFFFEFSNFFGPKKIPNIGPYPWILAYFHGFSL